MSSTQLEKFISVVSNDPAVLRKATQGEEDLQKCARNVVAYAKAQGYDFTEDEAKAWLAEHSQALLGGELKDSQLDAVAGGIIPVNGRGARAANTGGIHAGKGQAGWVEPDGPDKQLKGQAGWVEPDGGDKQL